MASNNRREKMTKKAHDLILIFRGSVSRYPYFVSLINIIKYQKYRKRERERTCLVNYKTKFRILYNEEPLFSGLVYMQN